jgi:hypothetical protein
MDTERIIERLIRWLSDPRGREMLKTIVYLVFPLIVLFMLRGVARRRKTEKRSPSIRPGIRPPTTESLSPAETLKETKARHQEKIARELQEVLGREDSLLARARRNQDPSASSRAARPSEPLESNQKKMIQEELLKLFSRRPK